MSHHVIIRIEWRSHADGSTFNRPDAEANRVARDDTGGSADGFAHDRAGMIRTGAAVIRAGAASKQQAGQ